MFYFWRNQKWSVRYWRSIGFEWFWMKVILFEIPMPCRCKRAALWRMRSSGFYLVSSLSVLEVLSLHYCSFPTIILELFLTEKKIIKSFIFKTPYITKNTTMKKCAAIKKKLHFYLSASQLFENEITYRDHEWGILDWWNINYDFIRTSCG